MSVWFQLRFARKPMLFFGVIGAMLFLLGLVVGLVALYLRFGPPHLGFRPLLDLIMVLVISGVVLFGFGFVGRWWRGCGRKYAPWSASCGGSEPKSRGISQWSKLQHRRY